MTGSPAGWSTGGGSPRLIASSNWSSRRTGSGGVGGGLLRSQDHLGEGVSDKGAEPGERAVLRQPYGAYRSYRAPYRPRPRSCRPPAGSTRISRCVRRQLGQQPAEAGRPGRR